MWTLTDQAGLQVKEQCELNKGLGYLCSMTCLHLSMTLGFLYNPWWLPSSCL